MWFHLWHIASTLYCKHSKQQSPSYSYIRCLALDRVKIARNAILSATHRINIALKTLLWNYLHPKRMFYNGKNDTLPSYIATLFVSFSVSRCRPLRLSLRCFAIRCSHSASSQRSCSIRKIQNSVLYVIR
jgi:hypothetical protein